MDYPEPKHILEAEERIRPYIKETPVIDAPALSKMCGAPVILKLENMLRPIGSFKLRGAMNRFLLLNDDEKQRGVVAVSAGNHSQAVAYCAKMSGVHAVIYMPENTPSVKVEGTRGFGGDAIEIRLEGRDYDDSERLSHDFERESGRTFVHPFNDPGVIAGQGTVAMELLREAPDIETLVVPVGGGGLACGMSLHAKSINPDIRIIGAQPEASAPFMHAMRAGRYVKTDIGESIADALTGDIISDEFLKFFLNNVDEVVALSEEDIEYGISWLLNEMRIGVEGGAAVGVAAVLKKRISLDARKTAIVITGRGIDYGRLISIAEKFR